MVDDYHGILSPMIKLVHPARGGAPVA